MKKRIIILGASGQIGNVLYHELKKEPSFEVTGTSRKASEQWVRFDPFKDHWKTLEKADVLINCIGQINETGGFDFEKIHYGLTHLIIQNRKILNDPKIIQISALGASLESPVSFLNTKAKADEYLLKQSDTIVLRPSIICTHRTMLIRKMLMLLRISEFLGRVIVPKGFLLHRLQPVMPEDIAGIIKNICTQNISKGIINISGPEEYTYHDLVLLLFRERKRKLKITEIPEGITRRLVKHIIDPLFPGIVNLQQYQLLFTDNIANTHEPEKILGRSLTSAYSFLKKELGTP